MQIQQWTKEVKILASANVTAAFASPSVEEGGDAAASARKASAQARYTTLKELLARREELEAPLEDEEEEDAKGAGAKGSKGKSKGSASRGGGGGSGGGGGGSGGDGEENKVIHGMETIYEAASVELEAVEEESDAVEIAVDTWFDDHTVSVFLVFFLGGGRQLSVSSFSLGRTVCFFFFFFASAFNYIVFVAWTSLDKDFFCS